MGEPSLLALRKRGPCVPFPCFSFACIGCTHRQAPSCFVPASPAPSLPLLLHPCLSCFIPASLPHIPQFPCFQPEARR